MRRVNDSRCNERDAESSPTSYSLQILVNEAVLDSFGHISARSPSDPGRFLLPRAMPPSLVEADDMLELSVETSQPIDPRGRRVNGERYLHGEIYKARPNVNASCIAFAGRHSVQPHQRGIRVR